jgi:GT2 family glycosyltransferase
VIDVVSLVVPVHGDAPILAPLLGELESQATEMGATLRVVISDDASPCPITDGIDPDGYRCLEIEVVRSERNRGPGGARNHALAVVETPWVAFLDADVVPMAGWLASLWRLVTDDATADLTEGRMVIPGDDPPTPFTHATEAEPPAQRVAANMVFRTEVLRAVGGFDERFYDVGRRLHFREDAELAFRLEAAGATIAYDEALLVAHPPLPSSFWVPMRLARRYHFDPLLSRLHPTAFKGMNDVRRIGPVSLRRARHDAATALVVGTVALVVGFLSRRRALVLAGAPIAACGWAANAVALCWRRRVTIEHLPGVAVAAVLVPFVYLWHYWRGVIRFRHRPRL